MERGNGWSLTANSSEYGLSKNQQNIRAGGARGAGGGGGGGGGGAGLYPNFFLKRKTY